MGSASPVGTGMTDLAPPTRPRSWLLRHRLLIAGLGIPALVVGFFLFRPDTLIVDRAVAEDLTQAFVEEPDPTVPAIPETTVGPETAEATAPPAAADTTSAGPAAVTTGGLSGIAHNAAGTATVYQQDGRYVLRLEDDTDIQNGPDLYVWLLADDGYSGGEPGEYLDLGRLKGNVGGQNYQLPADFDPATHRTVLIWCLRFGVPFAAAPLG